VQITDALRGIISDLSSSLASGIGSVASFLPKAFLFLVATLISLVYFALDLEGINEKVKSVLPPQWGRVLSAAREQMLSVGVRYVFSYFLVMLITFSVMLVGFFILRVGHPVLFALLIAFFDLFPIIGVGTVIIPWAIVEIILGNTARGIGLLVLFVVNELIRQFSEPRIVGKNLNVHPLFTLVLIYTSIALFGFKGIFLVPIFVALASLFTPSSKGEAPKKTGGNNKRNNEG
jgi:sporulation integral membrane protein YtvI